MTTLPALWERQPYESEAQWRAFQFYLRMEAPRSVDGAYRLYLADQNNRQRRDISTTQKRPGGGWSAWSNGLKYSGEPQEGGKTWRERAAAYDVHIERQLEEELKGRLVKKRLRIIEDDLKAYDSQRDKFWEIWGRTRIHERKRSEIVKDKDADGKETGKSTEIVTVEMNVDDWLKLSRWYSQISELGRRAVGMPEHILQNWLTGEEGGPIAVVDMHVDDLADIFQQIQRHKEQRGRPT